MATDIHAANAILQQPLDLNINRFAAPFHGPAPNADTRSPGMLAADLRAQQDLFSRLRFAYTKQVEKERTLDYLINQAVPQTVSDGELQDLEQETAGLKANLKERKVRVAEVLSDLELLARKVGQRHEALQSNIKFLAEHPQRVATLEVRAQDLQAAKPSTSDDPDMNLGAAETESLLFARERELQVLDNEILRLQDEVMPRQDAEIAELGPEIERLQAQEMDAVKDTKIKKDESTKEGLARGSDFDTLEMQARWLKAKETVMRSIFEV